MGSTALETLVLPACRGILLGMAWGGLALALLTAADLLIGCVATALAGPIVRPDAFADDLERGPTPCIRAHPVWTGRDLRRGFRLDLGQGTPHGH